MTPAADASNRRRRVVVTGGAGFIGSHVVDRLVALDADVLVVDDLRSGHADDLPAPVRLEVLDIVDPGLEALLGAFRPDAIVHAAAEASTVRSFADPTADARTNVLGTIAVAQAAAALDATLVYVTTGGALYGHPRSLPCDEDHPVEPLSPYGVSKFAGEGYARLLAGDRVPVIALRLANVYGLRQRTDLEGGVVAIFVDRLARGEPIPVLGDGTQTRDFVHVDDIVRGVLAASGAGESATLNLGTGVGTSINELVAILGAVAGRTPEVVHAQARPGDVLHSRLDATRAATVLGWVAQVTLRDGLARLWGGTAGHLEA